MVVMFIKEAKKTDYNVHLFARNQGHESSYILMSVRL